MVSEIMGMSPPKRGEKIGGRVRFIEDSKKTKVQCECGDLEVV